MWWNQMDWIESRIRVSVLWINASTCPSKPLIKFNGFPFLLHLYVKFNIKVKVFLSDYPNIYMYGNQVQWIKYNLLPFLDHMLRDNRLFKYVDDYAVYYFFRAMILDVGGRRHKVLESNFSVFPNTRLGKLARARNEEEILGLCDGYRDDDGVGVPEYFFDRNWTR